MKRYEIKIRSGVWVTLTGQPPRAIAMCPERELLVELAQRMVQLYGGQVCVYDEKGEEQSLYQSELESLQPSIQ